MKKLYLKCKKRTKSVHGVVSHTDLKVFQVGDVPVYDVAVSWVALSEVLSMHHIIYAHGYKT